MSLTRILSGTLMIDCEIHKEPKDKFGNLTPIKLKVGDPVVIVGVVNLLTEKSPSLICLTAEGIMFFGTNTVVKVTIDKELRERFAESTLAP